MAAPRLRTAVGWLTLPLLISTGGVPLIEDLFDASPSETRSGVVLAVATAIIAIAALVTRARCGPPRTIETAVLAGSLPVLVLGVAVVGWRLDVGYYEPDFLLREQDAYARVVATSEWATRASVAVVIAFFTAAAVVLEWERWTVSWRRIAGALALTAIVLGVFVAPILAVMRVVPGAGLLDLVADLVLDVLPEQPGARVSFVGSGCAAVLALALLAAARTHDRRRMLVGTSFAAIAVALASYPDAVRNEFPGFFCFTTPPGPASWTASVFASHAATRELGALIAVSVLGAGALLASRSTGWRGWHRDACRAGCVTVLVSVPCFGVIAGWQSVRAEMHGRGDPDVVEARARLELPSIPDGPTWWIWGGDYRWRPVIADASRVRTGSGSLSWSELRTSTGAGRLRAWLEPADASEHAWWFEREPAGVRLYVDRALPVARLKQLASVARLDGFTIAVSAPSEPYYDGLPIAERELRRLIVWVGAPRHDDGSPRRTLSSEHVGGPSWLAVGGILVDHPPDTMPCGEWIERMHHAAAREDARLVMLDLKSRAELSSDR